MSPRDAIAADLAARGEELADLGGDASAARLDLIRARESARRRREARMLGQPEPRVEPREVRAIQSAVLAGRPWQEVADQYGVTLARVRRYASSVLPSLLERRGPGSVPRGTARPPIARTCGWCGGVFHVPYASDVRRTCGASCGARYAAKNRRAKIRSQTRQDAPGAFLVSKVVSDGTSAPGASCGPTGGHGDADGD